MNKNLKVLLFVIALTSCLPQPIPNTPIKTQQENPTQKPEPTNTVLPAPSVTTTFVVPDLQKNCISISSNSNNKIIDGTAVFLDHLGQSIMLMGEHELQIPEEFKGNNGNSEQSVSPDGNLLMYRQVKYEPAQSNLTVVASDGHVVRDFPDDQRWVSGTVWLSNEYIRYPMKSQTDNKQLKLYALNVVTGKTHELRTDLPDIADNDRIDWGIDKWAIYFGATKGVNIVYDSSLNLTVYPKKGLNDYLASLHDVHKDTELAAIQLAGSDDPKWSPDGQYFSIIGVDPTTRARDIYIVSRDGGQFMPLTNLTKLYPKVNFESYSWSPDSSQIAFWAHLEDSQTEDNDSSLFLFDVVTMKLTDLCIKGIGNNPPLGIKTSLDMRGKPIWSPDSRKLLIARYDSNTKSVIDTLIDLENKIAYPVATDLEPIGWMK